MFMNRRDFLKAGAQVTVLGAVASPNQTALAAPDSSKFKSTTSAILVNYSAEDHRRRLQNIAIAERSVRACLRKHLITDYLPGHCVYNLGEYPCRKPWNPDDWDEQDQHPPSRLVTVMPTFDVDENGGDDDDQRKNSAQESDAILRVVCPDGHVDKQQDDADDKAGKNQTKPELLPVRAALCG